MSILVKTLLVPILLRVHLQCAKVILEIFLVDMSIQVIVPPELWALFIAWFIYPELIIIVLTYIIISNVDC